MIQKYFNNNSEDLILFLNGWGCDERFVEPLVPVSSDVLVLSNYTNLNLDFDFDFSKYKNIDLIAFSAGVFMTSYLNTHLPKFRKKIAVSGSPFLFDSTKGLSEDIVALFRGITLDNYLSFRKNYMVYTDSDFELFNKYASLRTIEDCKEELENLQTYYSSYKQGFDFDFNMAIIGEEDRIMNPEGLKSCFKKYTTLPDTGHFVFGRFDTLEDILNTTIL